MEVNMKSILRNSLIALFTFSSAAFAAGSAGDGQSGFLLSLFIGFFALILMFQIVPAFLLFIGLIRGLLSHDHKEAASINR
jgi:hypothetical protein